MSEVDQFQQVKKLVVEAFNHQTNTNSEVDDWKISLNRFDPSAPLSVRLFRDRFSDGKFSGTQIQVDFTIDDAFTEVGTFRLMLLPNLPAGDLRNEIQVATAKMDPSKFKELLTYIRSAGVRDYINSRPLLNTQDGSVFCVLSGQPFQTLQ